MKYVTLISLLLYSYITMGQQQTNIVNLLSIHTTDRELPLKKTTEDFTLATQQQLWTFETNGWLPLQKEETIDALACGWSDGLGGLMECPPGSVGCAVYTSSTRAAIACESAEGRILRMGLYRPL